VRVLLVSCYELGHQPQHLASPAAVLRAAGHDVEAVDLALDPLDDAALLRAEVIGIAVPMHTAMQLAVRVVGRVREVCGDGARVVLYGLYAPLCADAVRVSAVIGGEYEDELARFVASSSGDGDGDGGSAVAVRPVVLDRLQFPTPARDLLPPLHRYARLLIGGEERVAGHTEATRGCVHRCRHCPVPAVYDGRIRVVQPDVVVADIAQQVDGGATHITFGDPDFLNAVPHAMRVLREAHQRFPNLTFDVTTKVSHVVHHAALLPELHKSGVVFAVTAVESLSARVLEILDKGHTAEDAVRAVHLLRGSGIEVRPSLLPFTPWSGLRDWLDLLDFVAAHDLVGSVDPVQLSIRLLVPEGSLLLARPEMRSHLRDYDAAQLAWRWEHPDPRVDALQAEVAALVARDADAGVDAAATHGKLRRHAEHVARDAGIAWHAGEPVPATAGRPRLSEPWFC
jgi:pyruvate-formate lyase-activating enzyme